MALWVSWFLAERWYSGEVLADWLISGCKLTLMASLLATRLFFCELARWIRVFIRAALVYWLNVGQWFDVGILAKSWLTGRAMVCCLAVGSLAARWLASFLVSTRIRGSARLTGGSFTLRLIRIGFCRRLAPRTSMAPAVFAVVAPCGVVLGPSRCKFQRPAFFVGVMCLV